MVPEISLRFYHRRRCTAGGDAPSRAMLERERSKVIADVEVVYNSQATQKIFVSPEGDGGFAVVDINTLWRKRDGTGELPNIGRACKIYTLMPDGWKMLHQPGTMHYPVGT